MLRSTKESTDKSEVSGQAATNEACDGRYGKLTPRGERKPRTFFPTEDLTGKLPPRLSLLFRSATQQRNPDSVTSVTSASPPRQSSSTRPGPRCATPLSPCSERGYEADVEFSGGFDSGTEESSELGSPLCAAVGRCSG